MSDRDRIAAVVLPALPGAGYPPGSLGAEARVLLSLAITDALIAAGVTMPPSPCEHGVSASCYCPACGKCNCASCNDDGGGF